MCGLDDVSLSLSSKIQPQSCSRVPRPTDASGASAPVALTDIDLDMLALQCRRSWKFDTQVSMFTFDVQSPAAIFPHRDVMALKISSMMHGFDEPRFVCGSGKWVFKNFHGCLWMCVGPQTRFNVVCTRGYLSSHISPITFPRMCLQVKHGLAQDRGPVTLQSQLMRLS